MAIYKAIRTALGKAFLGDTFLAKALPLSSPDMFDDRLISFMQGLRILDEPRIIPGPAIEGSDIRAFFTALHATDNAARIAAVAGAISGVEALPPALEALFTALDAEVEARYAADTILSTYLSVLVPSWSAVTGYVSGSPQAVASLTLPAGTWHVTGDVVGIFEPTAAYVPRLEVSISRNIASLDYTMSVPTSAYAPSIGTYPPLSCNAPGVIVTLSGTAPIYLQAQGTFANGTLKCCGSMIARRIS